MAVVSSVDREAVIKKLIYALWGMLTLVLFFSVVLLANEIRKNEASPLDAFRLSTAEPARPVPKRQSDGLRQPREIVLYFASKDGRGLVPERQEIPFSDSTVENCRGALERLIAGPRGDLTAILPATAKIRALYLLEEGELVIDFSREILMEHARFKSTMLELLMTYGIVNTLTQGALQVDGEEVTRIRFLFEGSLPQESFPAHIDLSAPIGPDRRWIAAHRPQAPHG